MAYYFDWNGLEDFTDYPRDSRGLPMVSYGKMGLKYNPITIAQFGLDALNRYAVTNQSKDWQRALSCAQWLCENVTDWKTIGKAWVYDFPMSFYRLMPPWISAMAQGEAISLLLRVYSMDKDPGLLAICRSAFDIMQLPLSQGGVLDFISDDCIVFQEYPTNPPAHVLNGHIFALFGIYDFAIVTGDRRAHTLVISAVDALLKNWQRWEQGFWTRYDLFPIPRLASHMYQKVHIRQMRALAQVFEINEFDLVAQRWQRMLYHPINNLRWLVFKIVEKAYLCRIYR